MGFKMYLILPSEKKGTVAVISLFHLRSAWQAITVLVQSNNRNIRIMFEICFES